MTANIFNIIKLNPIFISLIKYSLIDMFNINNIPIEFN